MEKAMMLKQFLRDCDKADYINEQIQEVEEDIKTVEQAIEVLGQTDLTSRLLEELHSLRIKRLTLESDLHMTELKIIRFQLEQELAE